MVEPSDEAEQVKAAEQPLIGLAEFLESSPPGSHAAVRDIVRWSTVPGRGPAFAVPDIQLHCPWDQCRGVRTFRPRDDPGLSITADWRYRFVFYVCRNCEKSRRIYALAVRSTHDGHGEVYKVGEVPPFGPPVPPRVISLVGPDRDLFLTGRRAENHGLGVGAFAYYRRVVESQWRRLVDEIIRVSERVSAPEPMLAILRRAVDETQFSKAVDLIKDGVPEVLKINGHNPLTLLYAALSEGLHDKTDDECLELASSVRIVLTELAERITQALRDERELQDAVTRLLTRGSGSRSGASDPPA